MGDSRRVDDDMREAGLELLKLELADRIHNKEKLIAGRWEFLLTTFPIGLGVLGLWLEGSSSQLLAGALDRLLPFVGPIGHGIVFAVSLLIGHKEEVVALDKKYIKQAEKALHLRALLGVSGFEELKAESRRYFAGVHFYLRMTFLLLAGAICSLAGIQQANHDWWLWVLIVTTTLASVGTVIYVLYILEWKHRLDEPEEWSGQPE